MTKYRTIDMSTLAGLKQAEQLQARGWKIVRSGLFLAWMEKKAEGK